MVKSRANSRRKRKVAKVKEASLSPGSVHEEDLAKPLNNHEVICSDLDVEVSDTDHLDDISESTNEESLKDPTTGTGTAQGESNAIRKKKKRKKSHVSGDESEYSSDGIKVNIDDMPNSFKSHLTLRNVHIQKENIQLKAELDALRGQKALLQGIPTLLKAVQDLIVEVKSAIIEASNIRDEMKIAKTEAVIMRDEVKLANVQTVTLRQEVENIYQAIMLFSPPVSSIKEELTKANIQVANVRQEIGNAPIAALREEIQLSFTGASNLRQELQNAQHTLRTLPIPTANAGDTAGSFNTAGIAYQQGFENTNQVITVLPSVSDCTEVSNENCPSEASSQCTLDADSPGDYYTRHSPTLRNESPILISDESEDSVLLYPAETVVTAPVIDNNDHWISTGPSHSSGFFSTQAFPSHLSNSQEAVESLSKTESLQASAEDSSLRQNVLFDTRSSSLVSSTQSNAQSQFWSDSPLDPNNLKEDYFDFGPKRVSKQKLKEICHRKVSILVSELCLVLFTPNELALCSVSGRKSNAHKHSFNKKPLDPDRIDGIVNYVVMLTNSKNRMEVHHEVIKVIKVKLGNHIKTQEARSIIRKHLSSVGAPLNY